MKLNNFDEIEKTPAYMRRNVELIDTPNAKDINVSKYTLSGDENSVEIKKNNSFLHDNVD
jgi:cell division protein FtsZ